MRDVGVRGERCEKIDVDERQSMDLTRGCHSGYINTLPVYMTQSSKNQKEMESEKK
jgi:hypothetical protein